MKNNTNQFWNTQLALSNLEKLVLWPTFIIDYLKFCKLLSFRLKLTLLSLKSERLREKIRAKANIYEIDFCNVARSSLSQLVAHFQIFRRLMKGKFDAYVLWPLAKMFQNWIVDRSSARDFTVYTCIFFLRIVTRIHLISWI